MVRVDVWLPDPASLLLAGAFGPGALIRIERSDDDGATFTAKTTVAIVASQAQYTYWDSTGVAASVYRYRVSDAAPATYSPYSINFAGTSPTDATSPLAYADLGDLTALLKTNITGAAASDARTLTRFSELLVTATDELIREEGGRDYFRHPSSGTHTWLQDGNGEAVLHVHQGLVSLSLLELSFDAGISYLTVDSSFYELRGSDPDKVGPIPAGEPYFHIRLVPYGPYPLFIRGKSTIRLTGAEGWSTVPRALREGSAQRARQLAFADPSFAGIVPGPSEQGGGATYPQERWPQITYHFLQAQRHRFIGCEL